MHCCHLFCNLPPCSDGMTLLRYVGRLGVRSPIILRCLLFHYLPTYRAFATVQLRVSLWFWPGSTNSVVYFSIPSVLFDHYRRYGALRYRFLITLMHSVCLRWYHHHDRAIFVVRLTVYRSISTFSLPFTVSHWPGISFYRFISTVTILLPFSHFRCRSYHRRFISQPTVFIVHSTVLFTITMPTFHDTTFHRRHHSGRLVVFHSTTIYHHFTTWSDRYTVVLPTRWWSVTDFVLFCSYHILEGKSCHSITVLPLPFVLIRRVWCDDTTTVSTGISTVPSFLHHHLPIPPRWTCSHSFPDSTIWDTFHSEGSCIYFTYLPTLQYIFCTYPFQYHGSISVSTDYHHHDLPRSHSTPHFLPVPTLGYTCHSTYHWKVVLFWPTSLFGIPVPGTLPLLVHCHFLPTTTCSIHHSPYTFSEHLPMIPPPPPHISGRPSYHHTFCYLLSLFWRSSWHLIVLHLTTFLVFTTESSFQVGLGDVFYDHLLHLPHWYFTFTVLHFLHRWNT